MLVICVMIPATLLAAVWLLLLFQVSREDWVSAAFNKVVDNRMEIDRLRRKDAEGREKVSAYSGLAAKFGISVLNAPGTIDADYRGEVKVILVNLSNEPFVVNPGERIAQMVIARYETVEWDEVEVLDETERGAGGFGSTGR